MAQSFRRLPRWLRISLVSFAVTFGLLTILAGGLVWYASRLPPANKSAWFQNVKAAGEYSEEGAWRLDFDGDATVPLYLVKDGELYLKLQATQPKYGLYMEIDLPRWDAAMLAELIVLHPDLRPMLPKPDAPDGGIRWFHPWPPQAAG
jgi:hypothetical protein